MTNTDLIHTSTGGCASCGMELQGDYCHACGERILDPASKSVRHFVSEGVRELTEVDGRLFTSVLDLVIHPGQLTRAYIDGRRKKYLRPISLFFLLNVIFFLGQGIVNINTYSSTLGIMMYSGPDNGLIRSYVESTLVEREETYDSFEEKYNVRSEQLARTMVVVQVPLLALFLLALFPRRLLYDHLVLSAHLYSFTLLMNVVLTAGIWVWLLIFQGNFNLEWPLMFVLITYFGLSIRGAYATGWTRTVASGVAVTVAYVIVLWLYRYLLFGMVMLYI